MKNKSIILCLLILVSVNFALASEQSMGVPAVVINGNTSEGALSELTLKLITGKGRVFVSTDPLSQIDTQASARIANEIACEYVEVDCKNYDFLYTLSSKHGVIGGPSAGAAMTLLTMASLEGIEFDNDISLTGTVNLDGSIGVVGSIDKKSEAAKNEGYTKILVPAQEKNVSVEGIEIIGVSDIREAYNLLTGQTSEETNYTIDYDEFQKVMKITAEKLFYEFSTRFLELKEQKENVTNIEEHYNETLILMKEEHYYSAASFSVRGIIDTQTEINNISHNSQEQIDIYSKVLDEYENMTNDIEGIDSINDIEVILIIKDRINEARVILEDNTTIEEKAPYFEARVTTVKYWFETLDYFDDSIKMKFNEKELRSLAELKLFEARDSIIYAKTILDDNMSDADIKLQSAGKSYTEGKHMIAISEAIEAKTLANLYLELYGMEDTVNLRDYKKEQAEKYISLAQSKGLTPILAMSYFEYAKTLESDSEITSLIYLSYSKEFALISSEISEYENSEQVKKDYGWILLTIIFCLFLIAYFRNH